MSDSTQRFSGRAQDYHRYRQRYPAEQILAHLRPWCDLCPEWLIADVGAGTGMLTEVFLENGNPVIAVEPNADMRHAFAPLGQRFGTLTSLDATAEQTTLPDGAVEMIAAGRAFHWFDKGRALAEFRRIAKPGGWLVLVSQSRARNAQERGFGEQAAAFECLLKQKGIDAGYVPGGYRAHENFRELFLPEAEFHHAALAGTQELDWHAFRGQTMSLSMVPHTVDPRYAEFQGELRRLFESYASNGVITIPTTCNITAGRL